MNTTAILALEVTVATNGWREAVAAPEEVAARAARAALRQQHSSFHRNSKAPAEKVASCWHLLALFLFCPSSLINAWRGPGSS